jgi:hypothetical protein
VEYKEVKGRLGLTPDDPADRIAFAEVPARQLVGPERLEAQAVEPQSRAEEHDRQQGKKIPPFVQEREGGPAAMVKLQ